MSDEKKLFDRVASSFGRQLLDPVSALESISHVKRRFEIECAPEQPSFVMRQDVAAFRHSHGEKQLKVFHSSLMTHHSSLF
jgi:hypothetical protein